MVKTCPFAEKNFSASAVSGDNYQRGIIRVIEEDGLSYAIFRNPKDSVVSGDSYQRFPLDGTGVLIFPAPTQQFGEGMLAFLAKDRLLEKISSADATLEDLDKILKRAHEYYTSQSMMPDLYNTDVAYQERNMVCVIAAGQHTGSGLYSKKSYPVSLIVIKASDPQQIIEFQGSARFVQNAAQFGSGYIVLISEGDEIRKMAPDFACEHYNSLDNMPLVLEKLPSFQSQELKAGLASKISGALPSYPIRKPKSP